MSPVFNANEHRVLAGIRILVYIFIAFPIVMFGNAIPLGGYQFLLTTFLTVGFFWLMFRFVDHRTSIRIAGIQPDRVWWLEFAKGSIIAALVMAFIFFIQIFTGTLEFLGFSWNLPGTSSWFYPVFVFFIQMSCVGFYEEVMSRSYLLTNFKEGFTNKFIDTKWATIIAVLFSSSIFGLAHALNPNVTIFALLNIFLAGIMLAIPYLITGRLAFSVGIHFAWNFFQGGIFGFRVSGLPIRGTLIQTQQSGDAFWTGASFGPEGGLIGTVGIVLVTIASLVWIKKSGIELGLHKNFQQTYLESEGFTKEKE